MRQRKSIGNRENLNGITQLRRSPRFLQQNQPNPEDPKTPKLEARKSRVSFLDLTPLSSSEKGSSKKLQKLNIGEVSGKAKETRLRRGSSSRFSTGERRSARLNGGGEDFCYLRQSPRLCENASVKNIGCDKPKRESFAKTERQLDLCGKSLSEIDKPVTRGSIRRNKGEGATDNGKGHERIKKSISGENVGLQYQSDKGKVNKGVNLSKQCLYNIEKRMTRSATQRSKDEDAKKSGDFVSRKSIRQARRSATQCSKDEDAKKSGYVMSKKPIQRAWLGRLGKRALSHDGKAKQGLNLSEQAMRKPENRTESSTFPSAYSVGGEERRGVDNELEKKIVGEKRNKIQVEEGHSNIEHWTREQELELQRAYFAAIPTPHFWKKVAKRVPGKSAQECFDKIHSDQLTPPQPQPRSRAKRANSSFPSLAAAKLLSSSEPKSKKPRYSKQKSFLTHKTVRQLLQKHCNINQVNEADLFSVLEPMLDPSTRFVQDGILCSTPGFNKEGPGLLKRCQERSSSANRKHLSRLNNSSGATVISPPVLKQIKNKALHEKYIDQLHIRHAKRKAASLRATKCIQGKSDAQENQVQRREAVKAAKNALVFEARDAIKEYHHLQSSMVINFGNDSPDYSDSPEDEIEDGS